MTTHTSASASSVHVPLGKGLPLLEARFLRRPNQFTVVAEYQGQEIVGAMADRGRLLGVLVPGRPLLMERRDDKGRKTPYQILAARGDDGALISLDTHLPNRLVKLALATHALDELPAYTSFRPEQKIGKSRFDFVMESEAGGRMIMEVKSVGRLDPDRVARFPDAPTTRGVRHVQELIALQSEPETSCVLLFLIQGDGATHVEVDREIDPALHRALCEARAAGVHVIARACRLEEAGLFWREAREVRL